STRCATIIAALALSILTLLHPRIRSPPFFRSNATPPTDIYTLSLHDALPIFLGHDHLLHDRQPVLRHEHVLGAAEADALCAELRSEEHTSELQSRFDLVCRLLLEKKKIEDVR